MRSLLFWGLPSLLIGILVGFFAAGWLGTPSNEEIWQPPEYVVDYYSPLT
ncbi:MAG: hypothetical protein N838_15775 [Thiohalocapsa sp. PB-PSB1]|nr:MAG: hypothetical protein N838_15775 [Thiohalocapsa sp. PB-PSB1]